MKRIVSFGEIMLRLNPKGYCMLFQSDELVTSFAGSEANVSVSLVNFGMDAVLVTKVPDHVVGHAAIQEMRKFGVDVSHMILGGSRMGIYFVERGVSQRPSKVIYDRTGSSIATASRDDFDWAGIFQDADWFHFSGITPALSDELAAACEDACRYAKAHGITISCDINYRAKLWSREKARQVMGRLLGYVDVVLGNETDTNDVFGIGARDTDICSGKISRSGYVDVAKRLAEQFGCKIVSFTLRGSLSASVNEWAAMLYTGGEAYFSPGYTIQLVDRVGSGDSFAAALIYGLASGYDPQTAVNFAVAASCLKHTIENDFNRVDVSDVNKLMNGDGSGRVQR